METLRNPDLVRTSCAAFQSDLVKIDFDKVGAFGATIDREVVHRFCDSSDGLSTNRFDTEVAFDSVQSEAGFILVAHGLDFGSGFRNMLHSARNGQGAWLTVRAGLVRMGQCDPKMSSSWLASRTLEDVTEYFDLGGNTELLPLASQLLVSIRELGENIAARGFASPGDYLASILGITNEPIPVSSETVFAKFSASNLVAELVEAFPLTFKDEYSVNGQQVCFFKKAQLVVSELFMRFYQSSPRSFNFQDVDNMTAFVDNVVVAMIRKFEVISCKQYIHEHIVAGQYILKGSEEEVALRAAALTGVELLVARANLVPSSAPPLNPQRLCNWLWGCLGKMPENRSFPRHLSPSTSFY
jgi:hypothetical protein